MAHTTCRCGYTLTNNASPNNVELAVFTDSEWEDVIGNFLKNTPPRPNPPRTVWICPKCQRVYVWDGSGEQIVYALESEEGRPVKPIRQRNYADEFRQFQIQTGVLRESKSSKINTEFTRDLKRFLEFFPTEYRKYAKVIIYKYLLREDDVLTIFSKMPNRGKNMIVHFIDKGLIEDFVWECGYDITNIEQNYWGHHPDHNDGVDDTNKGFPQWYEPMLKKMRHATNIQKLGAFGKRFENFIEDFED